MPESVVMRMLGHRSRNVFERYNVVSQDDLWDAVRRIESGQKDELAEARAEAEKNKKNG